jgi:hypothetical protein
VRAGTRRDHQHAACRGELQRTVGTHHDVGRIQRDQFRTPQAGSVAHEQQRAIAYARNRGGEAQADA